MIRRLPWYLVAVLGTFNLFQGAGWLTAKALDARPPEVRFVRFGDRYSTEERLAKMARWLDLDARQKEIHRRNVTESMADDREVLATERRITGEYYREALSEHPDPARLAALEAELSSARRAAEDRQLDRWIEFVKALTPEQRGVYEELLRPYRRKLYAEAEG